MKIQETGQKYGSICTLDVYYMEFNSDGTVSYLADDCDTPEIYIMRQINQNADFKVDVIDNALNDFVYISDGVKPAIAHQILAQNPYLYDMLIDPSMIDWVSQEVWEKIPKHMLVKGYNPRSDFLDQLKVFNTKSG